MTDHLPTPDKAGFAVDRLREVIDSMRVVWHMSLAEGEASNPIDLYVVDADVVIMFLRPIANHFYGALLRYDGHARKDRESPDPDLKRLETRIVEFLGNIIFFQLRPYAPLLLLPSHADELERKVNDIWKDAFEQLQHLEEIPKAISEVKSFAINTSKEQLATAAERIVPNAVGSMHSIESLIEEIYSSLRGDGAIGQLFRFDTLISSERISHVDQITLRNQHGMECYLPRPENEAGEYLAPAPISRLENRLYKTLMRLAGKHAPSRESSIRRDAQALAHLAWLNEVLAKEACYIKTEDGTSRRVGKLVLISGSHLLPQAIRELELRPLRGCIFAPLSFLGHRLMDEYFQRDLGRPRTHIEESTQGSQASALINFSDSMRSLLDSAIKMGSVEEISKALGKVRTEQSNLTESWKARQLFGPHSRMSPVSSAIEDLQNSGRSLDELEKYLESLSVLIWQSFARSVTKLSLRSVASHQVIQRNIPPVRFKHFPYARQISRELYYRDNNAYASEFSDAAVLSKPAIEKLKREDPSHYTEFVCYALFCLVKRNLLNAEGCAELALSVAESIPNDGKNARFIKGDEALYLLAHIIRLRAEHHDRLDRAECCIDLAIEASRQVSETEGIEHINDIRFDSERFSIHCHQRYFECLGPVGHLHPFSSSLERDQNKANKLRNTFDEGIELLDRIEKYPPEKESVYILEYVRQQILVNLVQIALHRAFPTLRNTGDGESLEVYRPMEPDRDDQFRDQVKRLIDLLISQCSALENAPSGESPKASALATCVATVAEVALLNRPERADWFRPRLAQVAAIDGLRYKYLEGILKYCSKLKSS